MDVKKWLFAGRVLFCSVLLVACEYFDQTNEVKKVKETPVVQEKTEVKDPVVEEQKPEAEKPKAPKEAERVKLGETIGNDQIEVTFLNAYYTDDRNEYCDVKADKVLVIEYEYKNLAVEDGFSLFEGIHYQVYDGSGHLLKNYPSMEARYGGEVSIGRSTTGSDALAVVGDQTHYEIEIGDVIVEFDLE